jgi:hypothetical protein
LEPLYAKPDSQRSFPDCVTGEARAGRADSMEFRLDLPETERALEKINSSSVIKPLPENHQS